MQDEHRNSQPYPWVARILSIICVAICIGLMGRGEFPSWEFYAKFGYLSPESIWRGSYWSLFTSTLVHLEIWHLAFNVYWLWILGGRLEQSIGSLRFLAFFIAAGTIASSFQLAVSGTTGIGASGALYALFGFMWLARDRYPEFRQILDPRTVWLFLIWLVACYVITHFGDFRIGNTAHLSGLLFGCAVAGVRMGRSRAPAAIAGLLLLVLGAVIPLFWSPWSIPWLSEQAYAAHSAKEYNIALDYYSQILEREKDNAWALQHRGYIYQALDEPSKAATDLRRAFELEPSLEKTP